MKQLAKVPNPWACAFGPRVQDSVGLAAQLKGTPKTNQTQANIFSTMKRWLLYPKVRVLKQGAILPSDVKKSEVDIETPRMISSLWYLVPQGFDSQFHFLLQSSCSVPTLALVLAMPKRRSLCLRTKKTRTHNGSPSTDNEVDT